MKKFKVMLLVALVSLLVTSVPQLAFSVDISVSAQVPNSTPGDSIIIKELTTGGQDPWTGTTVSSMNFGQLTHALTGGGDAGVWYSQKYYCVFLYTTSYGHRYEVRSTCSGLTSGANSLPTGSFGITPGYASQDRYVADDPASAQGAQPSGSVLGSAGPAITPGSYKAVYTSEPAAANRIIRAFYSLPCYATGGANPFTGYTPIPLSQAAGTYSGTITITIAAI